MSDIQDAQNEIDRLRAQITDMDLDRTHNARERDRLNDALVHVRKIISEAAMTGFNCHDGDWAERLFASQALTHAALRSRPVSLQDHAQPENFARVRAENEKLREVLRTIQRTTFSGSQMSDEYVRGNRDAHTTCANMAGAALRAMVAEERAEKQP